MKYVKVYSTNKATISLPEPHECQVDGEIIPETTSLKIEIMHQAIRVCGV
jgi:diacylglycerol kinase family enzyme